jgi:small subunit ribosomal protein S20
LIPNPTHFPAGTLVMPNIKSAKKRMRQSARRRERNRSIKAALKTDIRKVREAVAGGKTAEGEAGLRVAVKSLDQAAAKGVIHRNKASRLKSRLAARIRVAKGKPARATG